MFVSSLHSPHYYSAIGTCVICFLFFFSGPAGTGKTESVKALGNQLGRFVLVFNCDETFDFQAMGRIFVGLCQVGAWGCFDEFNRLEERMLSAVSQQVQTIQEALKSQKEASLEGATTGSKHTRNGRIRLLYVFSF